VKIGAEGSLHSIARTKKN